MNTEPNGLLLLGPNPKVRSIFVIVAISFLRVGERGLQMD
jgi:hypothetical protein